MGVNAVGFSGKLSQEEKEAARTAWERGEDESGASIDVIVATSASAILVTYLRPVLCTQHASTVTAQQRDPTAPLPPHAQKRLAPASTGLTFRWFSYMTGRMTSTNGGSRADAPAATLLFQLWLSQR